jgi:hypothetical protein
MIGIVKNHDPVSLGVARRCITEEVSQVEDGR